MEAGIHDESAYRPLVQHPQDVTQVEVVQHLNWYNLTFTGCPCNRPRVQHMGRPLELHRSICLEACGLNSIESVYLLSVLGIILEVRQCLFTCRLDLFLELACTDEAM